LFGRKLVNILFLKILIIISSEKMEVSHILGYIVTEDIVLAQHSQKENIRRIMEKYISQIL